MLKVLYDMEHTLFWREGYQLAPGHQFTAISTSHLFNLHFPVIKIEEVTLLYEPCSQFYFLSVML